MLGFMGFLFVIGATLFLSYIYDICQGPKFRLHLPMFSGLFFAFFLMLFFLLDPYYSPGLSEFSIGNQFLLLPFVILAPLPYVAQWTGTVLQKKYIFFGAVLVTDIFVYFYGIQEAGRFLFEQYWQIEGLVWTICMIVPAFFIFLVFCLCQRYFSHNTKDTAPIPSSWDGLAMTEMVKFIVIIVMGILIFWVSLYQADHLNDVSCGGFEIALLNESQVANNSVRHLNEQDFRIFPRMAPFIRDNRTLTGYCFSAQLEENTCIGSSGFRCKEGPQFRQYDEQILEYKGRYYIIMQSYVV